MRIPAGRARELMVQGLFLSIEKLLDPLIQRARPATPSQFLLEREITLVKGESMGQAINAITTFTSDSKGYRVLIPDRVYNHPDLMQQATLINSIAMHALAYIVAGNPPGYYSFSETISPETRDVWTALRMHMRNPRNQEVWEINAELLAAALMFSPRSAFYQQIYKTVADYRRISEVFFAPIDSCVKWGLITLREFPSCYLEFNVDSHKIEDVYIPMGLPEFDRIGWAMDMDRVFETEGTVACQALRGKRDVHGIEVSRDGSAKLYLRAYYIPKDEFLGTSAKVIVSGFPELSYRVLIDVSKR